MWKNKHLLWAVAIAALVLTLPSCNDQPNDNGGGTVTPPQEAFKAIAPPVNADSMYVAIERQLAFGPRVPGTPAHAQCADWMAAEFKRYGAVVTMQSAVAVNAGKNVPVKNIIASYNPSNPRRVIVSAHWDSRPRADKDGKNPGAAVPAANDGGSGVAVILELARQFKDKAPTVGVDLILWDAEDNGNYEDNNSWCVGSQYWSKNKHVPNYRAVYGINLDMVGAKDARFTKDAYSLQYAGPETDRLWNTAQHLGYGSYFSLERKDYASIDDHYFVMEIAGIPMVEVIDRSLTTGEFFPHWHTTTDDMAAIDRNTLKAVGQTVLEVLYREQ
jgi:Zn-dependent M28 family amino/carboxypeptidase